jgi:hypothetical protein
MSFSLDHILLVTLCLVVLAGLQLRLQEIAKRRAERERVGRADSAPQPETDPFESAQAASAADTAEVRLRVVTADDVPPTWIAPDGTVNGFRFSLN